MSDIIKNLTEYNLMLVLILIPLFHLLFIKIIPLKKEQWKKIDYIWLIGAFIGLLSTLEKAQEEYFNLTIPYVESGLDSKIRDIRERIEFGKGPVICRTFITTEFSPPKDELDKIQAEYDAQCRWFFAMDKYTAEAIGEKKSQINFKEYSMFSLEKGDTYATQSFLNAVKKYNNTLNEIEELKVRSKKSELTYILLFLGPYFLTIALSLRFTKVTGEILLDRKEKSGT
ncbi:hypothetical protein AB3N62_11120 [Leptospira sp. WS4.C2]